MSGAPGPREPVLTFAEACDRGLVRTENQDSVGNARVPLGHLLLVADGIGGYSGGAVASRMVIDTFLEYFAALPADHPAEQAISEACARANAAIFSAAGDPDSPHRHMGSTVVAALFQQDRNGPCVWIAHIGDSRAYLAREGSLHRITNDHSAVQALLNRNIITPEQALNHPDASVLTRSLGHQPQVEPDIELVPLSPTDRILLCSDGLWGYVAESEIARVVADLSIPAQAVPPALLALAFAAGGEDNIGIEVAAFADPVPPPAHTAAPAGKPRRRLGWIEIAAICLFAFGSIGALITFAVRHGWLALFKIER